jgi:hypothetical protein
MLTFVWVALLVGFIYYDLAPNAGELAGAALVGTAS